MILPWLHPVMAPPYRYFLRYVPETTARVVICHNVVRTSLCQVFACCRGRRCVARISSSPMRLTNAPSSMR